MGFFSRGLFRDQDFKQKDPAALRLGSVAASATDCKSVTQRVNIASSSLALAMWESGEIGRRTGLKILRG